MGMNHIKEASESLANIKGISYDEAWMAIIQTMSDFNDNMTNFGAHNVRTVDIDNAPVNIA